MTDLHQIISLYVSLSHIYIAISQQQYQQKNMGNQQCQQCKQKIIQNHAYGAYEILQEGQNIYAVIEKKVQKIEQEQIKAKIIKQLDIRKNINNPHIVRLDRYLICNQSYGSRFVMFYEYVPKTLRDRIRQVHEKEQIFSQREIFSIIFAVQAGLEQLYQNKIKHNCLNLDTILIKNNIYKITDMSSLTYITSYNLASKGDRQQFLSQRLLQKLSFQSLYPIYSIDDDYFSLGLIALSIGAGRSPEQFYIWTDKKHGNLNLKILRQSIKKLEARYSSKLIKKIKQLLYQKETQTNEKTITINTKVQQSEQQYRNNTQPTKSLNSTVVSQQKSISRIFM